MQDILMSVPWCCGDNDCKQQWHKATYWIDGRGYTVDRFSDGDHESCRKRDLPTAEQEDKDWRDYSAYVLRTGLDPLCEFNVPREKKVVRNYEATFVDSIGGLMLVSVRTAGGRKVPLCKMPDELETYLDVESKGLRFYQRHYKSAAEVEVEGWARVFTRQGRKQVVCDCEVEYRTPVKPGVLAKALRAAARRRLRSK